MEIEEFNCWTVSF